MEVEFTIKASKANVDLVASFTARAEKVEDILNSCTLMIDTIVSQTNNNGATPEFNDLSISTSPQKDDNNGTSNKSDREDK